MKEFKLIYISNNEHKCREIQRYWNELSAGYPSYIIECRKGNSGPNDKELQTDNLTELLRDKVLRTFRKVRRPVFVEHTVITVDGLGGLPGTITQPIWDSLKKKDICDKVKPGTNFCILFSNNCTEANAKVTSGMCICDGRRIYGPYVSHCEGYILDEPRGYSDYQWDVAFVPKDSNKTFAEMGEEEKGRYSPKKEALKQLLNDISTEAFLEKLDYSIYNNEDIIAELKERIRKKQVMLFAGAGLSANVRINDKATPQWKDLLEEMAKKVGYDFDVLSMYGDFLQVAEYIRLKSEEQSGSWNVQEFINAEESEMIREAVRSCEIFKHIKELDFPIIYTTNYDTFFENLYQDYKLTVVSSPKDLGMITEGKKQLVKFHGSVTEPENIVLSESAYFNRIDLRTPLDLKFQVDVMTRSVLFIGYSLSDVNVRLVLYKINQLRKETNSKMKAYMFMVSPNPVQVEIFKSWGIEVICSDGLDFAAETERFLKSLLE